VAPPWKWHQDVSKCLVAGLLINGSILLGLSTRHGFTGQQSASAPSKSVQETLGLKRTSFFSGVRARASNGHRKRLNKFTKDSAITSSDTVLRYNGVSSIASSLTCENSGSLSGRAPATAYFWKQQQAPSTARDLLLPDWDWALLALPRDTISVQGLQISRLTDHGLSKGEYKELFPASGPVTVNTVEHGLYRGTLSPSKASFRLQGSIHDVRLIILDRLLPLGTSGAWVDHHGYVCGVLIAARQDRPWAYMLPIGPVLDDIRAALGTTDVRIPLIEELIDLSGSPPHDATRQGSIRTSLEGTSIMATASERIGSTALVPVEHETSIILPNILRQSIRSVESLARSNSASLVQTATSTGAGQLLPDTIPCTLISLRDGVEVGQAQHIGVRWNFPASFESLRDAAHNHLGHRVQDSSTQLYMKSGTCYLINDKTG
jgi:hypothetical protein